VFVILATCFLAAFTVTQFDLSTQVKGKLPQASLPDTLDAPYWGNAPRFDASDAKFAGADMCGNLVNVLSDATYLAATAAIIDATGFAGAQNCTTNPFPATAHPTKWMFGSSLHVNLTVLATTVAPPPTASVLTVPGTPGLSTSTSGGSLGASAGIGVKTEWESVYNPSTPSAEGTITTGAGATNSVTVTSPTSPPFGAVCYDVFSATPVGSGWKKTNTNCIPLGTNFVIKTIGAGAVPATSNNATVDTFEVDGGGSTWSLNNSAAALSIGTDGTYFHDLNVVTSGTSANATGSVYINQNVQYAMMERISCSGGGHCIRMDANDSHITLRDIHCNVPTTSASCIVAANGNSDLRIYNVLEDNSVIATGGNLQGVINLNGATDFIVDGVIARGLDFSNITNAAAIIIQNSTRGIVTNFQCKDLVNSDCVAVLAFSSFINISNGIVTGTTVGAGAGVGANSNNGDAIDVFGAGPVQISNVYASGLGLVGGNRFPCYEFYDSNQVVATNITCTGSTGEGVNMFGCTGCKIDNSTMTLNGKSGLLAQDGTATVSCNGTTTVTRTAGFPFGPWPVGTSITINGVAHTIAVVPTVDTVLTTAANCTTGAGQAFIISTQDTSLGNDQFDDNGTASVSATSCSGVDLLGSSNVSVEGGSANDNHPTATKKQCFAINASGAGSSFSAFAFDPSGNLGGTCSNEVGPAVAGDHWLCDIPKKSAFSLRDPGSETIFTSNVKRVTANVTNGSTTMANLTGMVWSIGASKKYKIECDFIYQAASTGGLQIAFTGPASPTQVEYCMHADSSATALNDGTACTPAANASFATKVGAGVVATINTNFPARFSGVIENGTSAGTLQVQFASAAAVNTIVERGSSCGLWSIN
jgi:hypothetical protein